MYMIRITTYNVQNHTLYVIIRKNTFEVQHLCTQLLYHSRFSLTLHTYTLVLLAFVFLSYNSSLAFSHT